MARGDKYLKLKQFLQNSSQEIVTLSFEDIEKIINAKLPKSALIYGEAWWSNNYDHSQAIAWMDAGYETDFVSDTYKEKSVVFVKRCSQ